MQEVVAENKETVVSAPESTSGGEVLPVSAVEKTEEKVQELVGESGAPVAIQDETKVVTKPSFFAGISQQISGLLGGGKKTRTVRIPSEAAQRSKLEKTFHQEINRLNRKAQRILKRKDFKADKYEEVIAQMRQFQTMLLELYQLAKDKLVQWYRQYVLKVA